MIENNVLHCTTYAALDVPSEYGTPKGHYNVSVMGIPIFFQSTTSTDRLLHSSGSGPSTKASIGAHVLHSIPPKTNQKSHKPYQSTTANKHTKYDKVATEDINSYSNTFDGNNKKRKVPKFYKVIPETLNNDDMGIDSQSQMKQNMSQIFSMEEPIKPIKTIFESADQAAARKGKSSLLPQVSLV